MKTLIANTHVFESSAAAEKFKTACTVAIFIAASLLTPVECRAQKVVADSSQPGKTVSGPQAEPKSENPSRAAAPSAGVNRETGRSERRVFVRIVVAGGKLSSLGGTVAGKVAKRFVKEMMMQPHVP